jgi:methylated-DNA-[protein]-cysteine S-methyltransferase
MGIAATSKGVSRIVLPRRSRRAVEAVLGSEGEGTGCEARGARVENREPRTANPEPIVQEAQRQLLAFLSGARRTLDVSLDLSGGTSFQRRVWRAIIRIPYGRARSYQWVACKVGGARYARAVGMALGANPVPLVIPCHRVVAHDASLGGFTGGLRLKRRLLALEGTLALLAPAAGRKARGAKRHG